MAAPLVLILACIANETRASVRAMLNLHAIEAPESDISARAVQALVSALDDPDGSARVAAAIALLAVAHGQPVQLVAVETAGVAAEVSADAVA
jgi:hypothetical protein